jgi:hypothetical protein
MTDTVITRQTADSISAVCRTWAGVFDLQRFQNCWVCSCGRPSCAHVAAVEEALVDLEANEVTG